MMCVRGFGYVMSVMCTWRGGVMSVCGLGV